LVTGTPGVGKTVISELLASRIKARLISLGDLVKREGLYTGLDRKRDTFVADLEKVSERVKEIIAQSTEEVVIEGHYATDVVPPEDVHLAFVLRRDPEDLRRVLRERSYREEKVRENLAAEILDVCLYDAVKSLGASKVCEIDVTGRRAEDVVEEVFQVLHGTKECRLGVVDWLGKLEAQGKLDEYLKEF